MSEHKKSTIVDIDLNIEASLRDTVYFFLRALQLVEAMYNIQIGGKLDFKIENEIYQQLIEALKRGGEFLPMEDRKDLENEIVCVSRGIFDLSSIRLKRDGKEYIDLILGKIFSLDRNNLMLYSGAVGIVNNDFDSVIEQYDKKLSLFFKNLPLQNRDRDSSFSNKIPRMRCIDAFALSGELNIRHKPICVFFSGNEYESTSALSRLTVFINLYIIRFQIISKQIARKILSDYSIIENLDYSSIGRLLLIWLRGHDIGHLYGVDSLGAKVSEFDRTYLILHELKSDFISLHNLRYLREDLLNGNQLNMAYMISIAEMFRYIRRGGFFNYPDSASAFLSYSFFREGGSISFNLRTKKFLVDFKKLENDIDDMIYNLLKIFSDGDVKEANKLVNGWGDIRELGEKPLLDELKVLEGSDIPHYIDYNFVTKEDILRNFKLE